MIRYFTKIANYSVVYCSFDEKDNHALMEKLKAFYALTNGSQFVTVYLRIFYVTEASYCYHLFALLIYFFTVPVTSVAEPEPDP
jgi:hypothetical protein